MPMAVLPASSTDGEKLKDAPPPVIWKVSVWLAALVPEVPLRVNSISRLPVETRAFRPLVTACTPLISAPKSTPVAEASAIEATVTSVVKEPMLDWIARPRMLSSEP